VNKGTRKGKLQVLIHARKIRGGIKKVERKEVKPVESKTLEIAT